MLLPAIYLNNDGKPIEAIRLTKKNVDTVANWCGGRKVVTWDPTNPDDWEGEVGVNFNGKDQTERVSEGEYLARLPHYPWFFKVDPLFFDGLYTRA